VIASGGPFRYSVTNGTVWQTSNVFEGLTAGTYAVLVEPISGGCGTTLMAMIVNANGSACTTPLNLRVTPGNTTADVTWAGISGADRYQLSWRRTTVGSPWITTTVSNATSMRISNLIPGATYEIRIRSRCGSVSSAWSNVVIFNTLTQREEALASETASAVAAVVYPNPSRGRFTIQLSESLSESGKLTVRDLSGREVYHTVLISGTTEIQVELLDLASGLYLMELSAPGLQEIHKLVIE